jgi:hypothetical protein
MPQRRDPAKMGPMPIHDWTKTYAGAFHHFHGTWLFRLAEALNAGLLPRGYYALGEQVIGGAVPDVLTLEAPSEAPAVAGEIEAAPAAMPSATLTAIAEAPRYPPRPRVIAVRHRSGHRLVAMVEIVSAGNKTDAAEIGSLVEKTVVALSKGVHVVLVDLHPPGVLDPAGVHNLIWSELGQPQVPFSTEKPLQVVSYRSAGSVSSFIEPRAVGEPLPDAPLFLTPARFVPLPLESTYQASFAALPVNLKEELGGHPAA